MNPDQSHLSAINARSRVTGYFYFSNNSNGNPNQIEPNQ